MLPIRSQNIFKKTNDRSTSTDVIGAHLKRISEGDDSNFLVECQ